MPTWTNRTAGLAARNGTTTHDLTFTAAAVNSLLVAVVHGPVTHTWPGGWTERLQPVNFTELSVATRTATAGESSVTVTHNAPNYPVHYLVYEFPSGSTWVNGAGASGTARGAAQPTVTGLPGTAVTVLYGVGASVDATSGTPYSATWTVTEDYDVNEFMATTDGAWLSVAYEDGVTATSATTTPTVTKGSGTVDSYERVTFAVNPAAPPAGVSPPVFVPESRRRVPYLVR